MSVVYQSVHLWGFVIAAWNKTCRVPSFVLCFPHSIGISLEVSACSIAHISTSITSIPRSSMSFRCISNCLLYILYIHSFIYLSDIIYLKCLLWIKHFPRYGGIYCLMKLCPILCNHIDCSSPSGSSIHGILQERTLEWVTISFSRKSSQPRDQICASCLTGRFFTAEPSGKPMEGIQWWAKTDLVTVTWQPHRHLTLSIVKPEQTHFLS